MFKFIRKIFALYSADITPVTGIPTRFEKNVPGDFYTTGDCLACDAPETEAPDLLAPLTDDNWDTYFIKQPVTAEEIERACMAVKVCCVEALRYGGKDPAIIRRLGNNPNYCDYLLHELHKD